MKLLIMKQESVQNEVVNSRGKNHQKLQNGQELVKRNEVIVKRRKFFKNAIMLTLSFEVVANREKFSKKCKYVDLELEA